MQTPPPGGSHPTASTAAWLASAGQRALRDARKAVNQWLDAPTDATSTPVFVVGAQRSGTTMLIDVLRRLPGVWVHPEKSPLAYDNFRLRSPSTISALTALSPGGVVIYKPVCDSHLTDRLLDLHPGSRAIWMVRDPAAVAKSAVAKWGDHHLQVLRDIAAARWQALGWRGERLPAPLIATVRELLHDDMTPLDAAALQWWLRNSFYFSLGLHEDDRVALVNYDALLQTPATAFPPVFTWLGATTPSGWDHGVRPHTATAEAPALDPRIATRCADLLARFEAHFDTRSPAALAARVNGSSDPHAMAD